MNSRNRSKSSRKKNKNLRNNRQSAVSHNDGIVAMSNALTRLPKSVTSIMPDRFYTTLRFYGLGSLIVPTITGAIGARYRPTSAYDIDPVIASTATPGFAELAAFYGAYRVTTSKITLIVANTTTTQGALVVICPLLVDPGASPSAATVAAWTENPYAKHVLVGTAGSPSIKFSVSMSTEKLFGSKMVYFDDNWTAATSTSPVNNWYWAIGAYCPAIPGAAVTVNLDISIEIGVEFFQRKVLSS